MFSQSLIDTSIPDEVRTINVSKCFHSLQNYAYHYWTDHVLNYAEKSVGFQGESILASMDRLLDQVRIFRARPGCYSTSPISGQIDALGPDGPRLAHLASYPVFQELLSDVLQFRALIRQKFGDGTSGISPLVYFLVIN